MKDKKGFTLVELLAVIAILAILVIIALPSVISMYNNAKKQVFLTEAQTVASTSEKKFLTGSITGGSKETVYCKSKTDEKNPLEMTGEKKYYYVQLASDGTTNKLIIWDDQKYIKYVSNGSKEISDLTVDEVVERDNSDLTCTNVLAEIGAIAKPDKTYSLTLSASNGSMELVVPNSANGNFNAVRYVIYKTSNYNTGTYTKVDTITSSDKSNLFKASYPMTLETSTTGYKVEVFTDEGYKLAEKEYHETLCFVAGTKVLTKDGYKNIEDIKVGDMVYSYNLDNNERELKKVTGTIISSSIDTYTITIENEKIEMTPRHQVYIIDKGWVRAYDLKLGDKVLSADKKVATISDIKYNMYDKKIKTYNLTIEGNSNYYVSNNKYLVHNATASPTKPGVNFTPSVTQND